LSHETEKTRRGRGVWQLGEACGADGLLRHLLHGGVIGSKRRLKVATTLHHASRKLGTMAAGYEVRPRVLGACKYIEGWCLIGLEGWP